MSKFEQKQRSYFQIGEMGYIGAGSKVSVFTRRSKPAFAKLKQIYGDHLENLHLEKAKQNISPTITRAERDKIKLIIKKEFRAEVFKKSLILMVSIILAIAIAYFLVWIIKVLLSLDIPR